MLNYRASEVAKVSGTEATIRKEIHEKIEAAAVDGFGLGLDVGIGFNGAAGGTR